jgi:transcriptional regulator with XRE-family HTH domain
VKNRAEDYIKEFGHNIKSLRKARKWSRETLSAYADIEAKQIYLIESGKQGPTLSTIVALALAFEIHPSQLFNFDYDFGVSLLKS